MSRFQQKDANMSATDNARRALEEYGRAEYRRGYEEGYMWALQGIADRVALLAKRAAKPTPAVEANGNAEAMPAELPPYLARAMEYLKTHPGATAWGARVALGNNQMALYELHKRGFARKDGPKFYPA